MINFTGTRQNSETHSQSAVQEMIRILTLISSSCPVVSNSDLLTQTLSPLNISYRDFLSDGYFDAFDP